MVITGLGTVATAPDAAVARALLELELGTILEGRVSNLKGNGEGVFRMPNGTALAFQGGHGLQEGEMVRLEVVRLTPEPALRILSSESRAAGRLAEAGEQSLSRAPETFRGLLRAMGFPPPPAGGPPPPPAGGGAPGAPGPNPVPLSSPLPGTAPAPSAAAPSPGGTTAATLSAPSPLVPLPTTAGSPAGAALPPGSTAAGVATLPPPAGMALKGYAAVGGRGGAQVVPELPATGTAPSPGGGVVTHDGMPLSQLFSRVLPQVSGGALLAGNPEPLLQLFARPPGPETAVMVRRLQEEAAGLRLRHGGGGEGELAGVRAGVRGVADLVAMQEVLPRSMPLPDGGVFLGYRVFWLPEGGFGDLVCRRDPERGRTGEGGEGVTTVLVSLEMSSLGLVQARLTQGNGQLRIGLGAESEESLAALRTFLGELRGGLQAAGLRVQGLDLARVDGGEMREERQRTLGLNPGFAAAV